MVVVSARDLLERVSDEVQILADLARAVEDAGVVSQAGKADVRRLNNIQELDKLVQSLADISQFVRACASTFTAESSMVDIEEPVSAVRLQTIRERLSGSKSRVRLDPAGSYGQLHLF